MKKIHLRKNISSAQLLTAEEMKCLTGGLFGTSISELKCNSSCSGKCVVVENNVAYDGTCNRNKKDECHCHYVVPGPLE